MKTGGLVGLCQECLRESPPSVIPQEWANTVHAQVEWRWIGKTDYQAYYWCHRHDHNVRHTSFHRIEEDM